MQAPATTPDEDAAKGAPAEDVVVVPGAGRVRKRPSRSDEGGGATPEFDQRLVATDPADRRLGQPVLLGGDPLLADADNAAPVGRASMSEEQMAKRQALIESAKRRVAERMRQQRLIVGGQRHEYVTNAPPPTNLSATLMPLPHGGATAAAAAEDPAAGALPAAKDVRTRGNAAVEHPYATFALGDIYDGPAVAAQSHGATLCELALLHTGNCRIEDGVENWRECARRIGVDTLAHVLPRSCTGSDAWRQAEQREEQHAASSKRMTDGGSASSAAWKKLKRGFLYESQTYRPGGVQPPTVPPYHRTIAVFEGPRTCQSGSKQYPISFAVPAANVAKRVSRDKWWGFLPYVPGTFPFGGDPKYHFGYQDEWLKDQLHQHSYFAWTHKRGGWDCMRHLEILAAGAIPYFADIELCPRMSLANYPKALIKAAMALQGVAQLGRVKDPAAAIDSDYMVRQPFGHVNFKKPGAVDQERFDRRQYFELADAILNHTRHHMTTAAVVAYVLQTIGYEEPNHALVIGRWTYDYLHQTIESGLSDLGIRTTVLGHARRWVQKIPFESAATTAELELHRAALAKQSGHSVLPGLGWLYGFRTDPEVVMHANVQRNDAAMSRRIAAGEFDLVIYTYTENEPVHRRWYWGPVERGIPKQRRVFLHHNDDVMDPDPGSAASCNHGWLFKREMRDTGC